MYKLLLETEYIKSVIYSGTDGLITIFNLLLGLNNFQFSQYIITIVLLLALVGDAISMGISDMNSKNTEGYNFDYKSGIMTFISFVIFGSIPLILYLSFVGKEYNIKLIFLVVLIGLITLGYFKNKILNKKEFIITTPLLGLFGALLSYTFSYNTNRIIKYYSK